MTEAELQAAVANLVVTPISTERYLIEGDGDAPAHLTWRTMESSPRAVLHAWRTGLEEEKDVEFCDHAATVKTEQLLVQAASSFAQPWAEWRLAQIISECDRADATIVSSATYPGRWHVLKCVGHPPKCKCSCPGKPIKEVDCDCTTPESFGYGVLACKCDCKSRAGADCKEVRGLDAQVAADPLTRYRRLIEHPRSRGPGGGWYEWIVPDEFPWPVMIARPTGVINQQPLSLLNWNAQATLEQVLVNVVDSSLPPWHEWRIRSIQRFAPTAPPTADVRGTLGPLGDYRVDCTKAGDACLTDVKGKKVKGTCQYIRVMGKVVWACVPLVPLQPEESLAPSENEPSCR